MINLSNAAYIHIPFCEHICHYCDFNKVYLKGQPVDEYLDALEKEMILTLQKCPTEKLNSIFVGGGTPTSLNEKQLDKFLQIIKEHLPFDEETEYTFEANPGDLSKEKFQLLFDGGVNRLSFGVQTFNDELLRRIGRTHSSADVYKSIERAKSTGFQNISVDLIYSLPGQTIDDFKDTLKKSFALNIVHFSGYSLIIEPKTMFYNWMKKGKLPLPGEDAEAEMYGILIEEMEKHGYKQYEISNFSRPGFESQHNLTYWNNDEYYGFGAGAHSYLNGMRKSNFGPLKKYMDPVKMGQLPIFEEHELSLSEKIEEEVFLGLRKTEGVSISRFIRRFNQDPLKIFKKELEDLQEKGLIDVNQDHFQLTSKGRFLGNEVFQSFLGVV